ncbi:MAG: hypothetical protein HKO54_02560 [Flavobacteriaceae bacterium]|nr:hypothetical protein [Flavobacteriaceae bacterium]
MNYQSIIKRSLLILTLSVASFGCGSGDSDEKSPADAMIVPKEQRFEATMQENTNSVPASEVNHLEAYDEASGTYTFSRKAKSVKDLQPGTVVLFETHSLRKIKSVSEQNGKIVVETDFAKLTEYFKDAEINYSANVNWNDPATASHTKMSIGAPYAVMGHPLITSTTQVVHDNPYSELKTSINGWKVTLKFTPIEGDRLKIKITAKKGNVCSIVAEGFISDFQSTGNISIANGETQNFSYQNRGLRGEMEVKFSAVGLGSEIAILQIPAKLERTILVYGIIPVTLRLKANLKILPEVAVGSSSQVSMKFTYDSNMGFAFDGSKMNPIGNMSSENPEQTGDNNTATTGIAGMGVAVEFPRFEIGVLNTVVVPYIVLETTHSSYLSTGLLGGAPPCHLARLKYKGNAGVTMSFFGVGSIHNDYKLFEKTKKWTSEGSHCGDGD